MHGAEVYGAVVPVMAVQLLCLACLMLLVLVLLLLRLLLSEGGVRPSNCVDARWRPPWGGAQLTELAANAANRLTAGAHEKRIASGRLAAQIGQQARGGRQRAIRHGGMPRHALRVGATNLVAGQEAVIQRVRV